MKHSAPNSTKRSRSNRGIVSRQPSTSAPQRNYHPRHGRTQEPYPSRAERGSSVTERRDRLSSDSRRPTDAPTGSITNVDPYRCPNRSYSEGIWAAPLAGLVTRDTPKQGKYGLRAQRLLDTRYTVWLDADSTRRTWVIQECKDAVCLSHRDAIERAVPVCTVQEIIPFREIVIRFACCHKALPEKDRTGSTAAFHMFENLNLLVQGSVSSNPALFGEEEEMEYDRMDFARNQAKDNRDVHTIAHKVNV